MHIALGCDHRGLELKQAINSLLKEKGHETKDFGCYNDSSVDYPDIARDVAKAVTSGQFAQGILICGTGIGMSMAANKVKGIRAALCGDAISGSKARQHNDANILCLGADIIGEELALDIVSAYLTTDFENGRHSQRLEKMHALETN